METFFSALAKKKKPALCKTQMKKNAQWLSNARATPQSINEEIHYPEKLFLDLVKAKLQEDVEVKYMQTYGRSFDIEFDQEANFRNLSINDYAAVPGNDLTDGKFLQPPESDGTVSSGLYYVRLQRGNQC